MIFLRNIDHSFLESSYNWLQDDDFLRDLNADRVTLDEQAAWYANLSSRSDYWVKGIMLQNSWVGAVGLKHISYNDICMKKSAEYFGYIYPRELRGRGLGYQAYTKVEQFAIKLGLQKIYLKVVEGNDAATAAYRKWGFKLEDRIEGEVKLLLMSRLID